MHTLSTVLVLTGLVSNLLTVHGRDDGHVATENCKSALLAETDCDLDSSKCICNYLNKNDLSHWTRELCDEADISIKSLYKNLCTDHPFLFPHRASAPMVRVGEASPSDDNSNPQVDTESESKSHNANKATSFHDKMSSLIAFPSPSSSPTSFHVSTPSSFPIASAVAIAKDVGLLGGNGGTGGRVRHPPNIHHRAVEVPEQAQAQSYTDASGMIHMPIVYKTVTTTHTRTECLCNSGPGGASASASASVSGGSTTSSERVDMASGGSSAAAESVPRPTETSHATMESSVASSSSSNVASQTPVPIPAPSPAPTPAAPTSTMLMGSPSPSSGVFGSSHGILGTEATSPIMSSTTTPVSESDLDSETLTEAIPTGVDPQRSGAGEVEEDGSRTTHAYESSAAGRSYGYGGVTGVVVGVVAVMAMLML